MKKANTAIPRNLGKTDRIIRFVIGAAMLSAAGAWWLLSDQPEGWFTQDGDGLLLTFLVVFGLYPLITAVIKYDPIYP